MKPTRIAIPRPILDGIRKHVASCLPSEACGLLGGIDGIVSLHIPVKNLLQSPVEFRMDPEAQLRGLIELDERKLDLTAIYHSHPAGQATPSITDLKSHLYPDSACIILAKKEPEWDIQAYWIAGGDCSSVLLVETD